MRGSCTKDAPTQDEAALANFGRNVHLNKHRMHIEAWNRTKVQHPVQPIREHTLGYNGVYLHPTSKITSADLRAKLLAAATQHG